MTRYYIAVIFINILFAAFFYFKLRNTGLSTKAFIFIGGLSLLVGMGFPFLIGFFDIYVVIGINLLIISLGTYQIAQLELSGTPNPENENTDHDNACVVNADPENADLENADPENADPENTDLENADLENADPENADPENADPENADPENTDLENADPAVLVAAAAEDTVADEYSDRADTVDKIAAVAKDSGEIEKQAEQHTKASESEEPETEAEELETEESEAGERETGESGEESGSEETETEETGLQETGPPEAETEETETEKTETEDAIIEESAAEEAEGAAEENETVAGEAETEETEPKEAVETAEPETGGEGEQEPEENSGMLPGQDNTVQGEETMISQEHGAEEIMELIYSYIDRGFDAKTGGKLDLAIKYFSSALDLDPPPDLKRMLVFDLHSMYRELGQYAEAKQCMEDLLGSMSGDLSNEEVREIKINIKYVEILQEMLNKANTPNLPYSKLPALIRVGVEGKVNQWLNEAFN